ncbi:MAG: 3-hydroxyacyl-CoA dehydrogenase PaaC [Gammaproteobacteria bacterium]|jgi:3-hydroxybutyryl-CoA dehydrogenase|nr:3-hydroxyacyl-CoA dehydrogenase PaaC [Gammaproteobacteria bacterium]MBT3722042.1 3-hydroxyacyl-CoA dehydrogenase PaaC [Gammaproteobacteria bacterium]MBT4078800.1 3-hydroxyacyl-CoA dehydrogenase PaaC [Gammaproteobacteria bacterium]MBT4195935.1 3-hydroxyacyl-CoA dehydrogenase PaaC [Gammaproteobacteria bacterium]MBT4451593.1 3-hydroxyacyl-CoA dehydrogenase PaaC [Gammaproteobacteria bacterium]
MTALDTSKIIAVIGAGTMGAGVAQVAANAGHQVLLFDVAAGAAQKGIYNTARGLDKLVQRGRISQQQQDDLIARITPVDNIEELAPASLFIEAIVEKLEVKQQLFKQLEDIGGPEAILATNTSSISVSAIASALKHPERLLGMHFFNPAPVMKLVEIISGIATDSTFAESIYDTAKAWGKQVVHAKSTPGFIVNRVARPFYAEGLRLLQEAATTPATIDAIMRDCGGFRMGPFELMDLIGHDVNYAVTHSIFDAYYGDQRFLPSLIQKELVDGGYLGRKSGRGFYDYSDGAHKPEPETCEFCDSPKQVTIIGQSTIAEIFATLLTDAGVEVTRIDGNEFALLSDNAILKLTNGQMATVRAVEENINNLLHLDLALDYAATSRLVISAADQAETSAVNEIIGLLQKTDKQVTQIDDIAGMCVMRTVCMLANEGADAVNQLVCSINAVDIAMKGGLNYPAGPLAWADSIGIENVLDVLDNLSQNYGEDRYRPSPLIVRKAAAGKSFYE